MAYFFHDKKHYLCQQTCLITTRNVYWTLTNNTSDYETTIVYLELLDPSCFAN